MKLVLDTDVLYNKQFFNWLLNSDEEKYLSAVVYMEYLYNQTNMGNTPSMVDTILNEMNVVVVPIGTEEAKMVIEKSSKDFVKNARDYVVGSTAILLDAHLVTDNLENFKWLENVCTPAQILEK
ncbi:MAG: type II toxin-antitoxin system VapC family toxin [Methanobacteriaceae archaeon]|jgi:predicted nucleic acid-binding protein|nr:type II toxin-antitoxin system VapC family toxin [Methanobacteriaceae archaeon]MDO9627131.1 type II toxin-antitoxin system VapC family toxin [Methanobacteriaceae archaeon]